MKKNNLTVISENQKSDFFYEKRKSNLNITFNRVSFIFFIFFIISTIFSIHLIHLGSRNDTKIVKSNLPSSFLRAISRSVSLIFNVCNPVK